MTPAMADRLRSEGGRDHSCRVRPYGGQRRPLADL